jgi:hypothetical protein
MRNKFTDTIPIMKREAKREGWREEPQISLQDPSSPDTKTTPIFTF